MVFVEIRWIWWGWSLETLTKRPNAQALTAVELRLPGISTQQLKIRQRYRLIVSFLEVFHVWCDWIKLTVKKSQIHRRRQAQSEQQWSRSSMWRHRFGDLGWRWWLKAHGGCYDGMIRCAGCFNIRSLSRCPEVKPLKFQATLWPFWDYGLLKVFFGTNVVTPKLLLYLWTWRVTWFGFQVQGAAWHWKLSGSTRTMPYCWHACFPNWRLAVRIFHAVGVISEMCSH